MRKVLIAIGVATACGAACSDRGADPTAGEGRSPIFQVGGDNIFLREVGAAEILSTGGLAVLETSEREVIFTSSSGDSIATAGGVGGGPGEFAGEPRLLPLVGGMVPVFDGGDGFVSFFDEEGKHLADRPLRPPVSAVLFGVVSDTQAVVAYRAWGLGRYSLRVVSLINPRRATEIATYGMAYIPSYAPIRRVWVPDDDPLKPRMLVTSSESGEIVRADALTGVVSRWVDGGWTTIAELGPRRPATPIDRAGIELFYRPAAQDDFSEALRSWIDSIAGARITVPRWDRILVGHDGRVLLRELAWDPADPHAIGEREWIEVGPDGIVDRFTIDPGEGDLLDIARGRMARRRDADWTDYVSVWRREGVR